MYEPQHLVDLQDNTGFDSDPKSWLSGPHDSSLTRTLSSLSTSAAAAAASGNVDRVLFNDLVEIVPLVQSLIDRKANTSFTRRGSMIYTKTPARESHSKKTAGRVASQSIPARKHRDHGENDQNKNAGDDQDGCADNFSVFSSKSLLSDKDREELIALREKVEDLQNKLSEKEEFLKSAELSKNELASVYAAIDELKNEAAEKDSFIKSSELQLSDAKVKLADRQAAVEKLQWEAMVSNEKVRKLEEDLEIVRGQISSFMSFVQGLIKNDYSPSMEVYDVDPYPLDHNDDSDFMNGIEIQKLEAAREAYIAALATVKEKQDEGSISAAASARLRLESLILNQTS